MEASRRGIRAKYGGIVGRWDGSRQTKCSAEEASGQGKETLQEGKMAMYLGSFL